MNGPRWWNDFDAVTEEQQQQQLPDAEKPIVIKMPSFDNLSRVPDYVFIPTSQNPTLGQPVHLCEMHGTHKRAVRLGWMPDPRSRRTCVLMAGGHAEAAGQGPVIRVKTSRLRRPAARALHGAASEDSFLEMDDSSRSSASSTDSSPGPLRRSTDSAQSFRPIGASAFHTAVLSKRRASELDVAAAAAAPAIVAPKPVRKRPCSSPVARPPEVPSFFCLRPITRGELDVERVRALLRLRTTALRQLLGIGTRNPNDRRYQLSRVIQPLLRLSDDEYALSCQHVEMFVLALVPGADAALLDRLLQAERDVLLEKMDACKSSRALERMLLRGGMLGLERSDDELDDAWEQRYRELYEAEGSMERLSVRRVQLRGDDNDNDALVKQLRDCHLSANPGQAEFPREWYATDWRNALDGVANRRVLMFRGQVYMTLQDLKAYAADRFLAESRRRVALYRERLWKPGTDDERLQDLRTLGSYELAILRKYTRKADRERNVGLVDLEDLLSHGPLCMVHLDRRLGTEHHLKHHERQQYAITAIKTGCSAASVTARWFGGRARWRHKQSVADPEKLERQFTQDYANYERKKDAYSSLSCYRINERDASGRQLSAYACPYSRLPHDELASLLRTEPYPVPPDARDAVLRLATQQRDPVSACNAHLRARIDAARKHANQEPLAVKLAPISHSDAYFQRLAQHTLKAALKRAAPAPRLTVLEQLASKPKEEKK